MITFRLQLFSLVALSFLAGASVMAVAETLPASGIERMERDYDLHGITAEAFTAIETMANNGDAQSQFAMGYLVGNGIGAERDHRTALDWYKKAAGQKFAPAYYKIGYYNQVGWASLLGNPDPVEAIEWYKKGVDAKDGFAEMGLGLLYLETDSPERHDDGIRLLKQASEQNIAAADFHMGSVYEEGIGVRKNIKEAISWYQRGAELGDADAMNNLGVIYHKGQDGIPADPSKAAEWYRKGADAGSAQDQFNIGAYYRDGYGVKQDYATALDWFNKAATQGHPRAEASLAAIYDKGLGVQKDEEKGFYWHKRSAEHGERAEEFNTGNAYFYGNGVAKDEKEGVYWWLQSAWQGDALAENNLGVSYLLGNGADQDDYSAYMWLYAAVARGYEHSRERRDVAGAKLSGEQRAKAQEEAQQYIKLGDEDPDDLAGQKEFLNQWLAGKHEPGAPRATLTADENDAVAEFRKGTAYYDGDGVTKDDAQAVAWWRKAADKNVLAAQFALGRAYERGEGVSRDAAQAATWYREAAEQGDGDAQKHLGMLYDSGEGVGKDAVQAYMWYTLANRKFTHDAIFNRDELSKHMTLTEIEQAEDMAKKFHERQP